ncbi:hypothetical protein BHE74_00037620 [Ensete ventricosum]|nr:hypothetical protein BHE74_00037620 [Ensete ventricosum]
MRVVDEAHNGPLPQALDRLDVCFRHVDGREEPRPRRKTMLRSSVAALKGWNSSFLLTPQPPPSRRCFRSEAALDALRSHSRTGTAAARSHLVLYNYPSFSGAFAALFAHLFHSHLGLPFLVLPFSSNLQWVILNDLRVIAFDHRESTLKRISRVGEGLDNLELRIDTKKSSARAAYDFFSEKLFQMKSSQVTGRLLIGPMKQGESTNLLNQEDEERVATVLRYVEDVDLRQWRMPDIEAFNIGLRDERAKVNCITNPFIFEQVCFLMPTLYTQRSCWERLLKSNWEEDYMASAWPIGAVVFMQRRNLKMCLRSTDCRTDTSEIAKLHLEVVSITFDLGILAVDLLPCERSHGPAVDRSTSVLLAWLDSVRVQEVSVRSTGTPLSQLVLTEISARWEDSSLHSCGTPRGYCTIRVGKRAGSVLGVLGRRISCIAGYTQIGKRTKCSLSSAFSTYSRTNFQFTFRHCCC